MANSESAYSLPLAPPPWKCTCTAYVLAFYNPASSGLPKNIAFAPLETNPTSFGSDQGACKYTGGLCFAQIIRYSDTPVGSYDELAILPGYFETAVAGQKKSTDMRITGIWVSQKDSLLNGERFSPTEWSKSIEWRLIASAGRRNWNIPK